MESPDTDYKSMFIQACRTLATIGEMLGIPEDEVTGDPDELYFSIEEMKTSNGLLASANERLVNALDLIHSVLNDKDDVRHSDIGLEKIINDALEFNAQLISPQPVVTLPTDEST